MTERPLRLGVVGANPTVGWASRTHLPALLALPEYELTAVCTTKQESAEAAAQKYDAHKAYWNFRDLVNDPDVEVVDVCVRVPYHHEIVMGALTAGKHVYCEWPLGADLAQAKEMAQLAKTRGVQAMCGLQSRGSPSLLKLHGLIAEGWVGRVLSVNMTQISGGLLQPRGADAIWRGDRTNGANTLTIAAGHDLDALAWTVAPFVDVAANVATLAPEWPMQDGSRLSVTAPDHLSMTGHLQGGAVATVEVASVPWAKPGFRMEVYGTEGTLIVSTSQGAQSVECRLQGAKNGEPDLKDIEVPADLKWIPDAVPEGTSINVAQMMRKFGESVRRGTPTGSSFEDAVRNHELLDAIERSSATGAVVRLG